MPAQVLACPRCTQSLHAQPFGSIELDWCRRCGGLWFDRSELRAFESLVCNESRLKSEIKELRSQLRAVDFDAGAGLYLNCPVCAVDLIRSTHEASAGVIVHRCTVDGAWLDWKDVCTFTELLEGADEATLRQLAEQRHRHETERRLRELSASRRAAPGELNAPPIQTHIHFLFDLFDLW